MDFESKCEKRKSLVDLRRSGRFIEQQFGLEVGEETVRRYLKQNGFSSRKGRRRTAGYKLDVEGLIDLYIEDVQRFWGLGVKDISSQYLACIDSSSLGWHEKNVFSERWNTAEKSRGKSNVHEPRGMGHVSGRSQPVPAAPLYGRSAIYRAITCARPARPSTILIPAESWP